MSGKQSGLLNQLSNAAKHWELQYKKLAYRATNAKLKAWVRQKQTRRPIWTAPLLFQQLCQFSVVIRITVRFHIIVTFILVIDVVFLFCVIVDINLVHD